MSSINHSELYTPIVDENYAPPAFIHHHNLEEDLEPIDAVDDSAQIPRASNTMLFHEIANDINILNTNNNDEEDENENDEQLETHQINDHEPETQNDSNINNNNNNTEKEKNSSKSSLLDVGYGKDRKASLSTESVEVYIYRRTSLVTSTAGSVVQLDESAMNNMNRSISPNHHHQRHETGMNLWETNSSSNNMYNYQLHEMNNKQKRYDEQEGDYNEIETKINDKTEEEEYEDEDDEDIITPIPDILNNDKKFSLLKTQKIEHDVTSIEQQKTVQNKARSSMEFTDKINSDQEDDEDEDDISPQNTVVHHRVSITTSVIIHGSDDEDDDEEDVDVDDDKNNDESEYVEGYLTISRPNINTNDFIKKTTKQHKMSNIDTNLSMEHNANQSSILQLVGSPLIELTLKNNKNNNISSQTTKMSENDLDEMFFIQQQSKKNKERLSKTKKLKKNIKKIKENESMAMDEKIDVNINNEKHGQLLTTEALLEHDITNDLNAHENDNDNDDNSPIHMTDNKSVRYIAMSTDKHEDRHQHHQHHHHVKNRKNNFSQKIKYVTAIGAVCAVAFFIGYVMYTRNTNMRRISITRNNSTNSQIVAPRRRKAPRIG